MELPHNIPEPKSEKPFEHCRLDREKYADFLTGIIETYSEGFVMALNNKWGEGKTTFIKMWQQKVKKFNICYFNAWENDFDQDPMVAILTELKVFEDKGNFNTVLKQGAVLFPLLLQALADKHINTELFLEGLKKANGEPAAFLNKQIEDYSVKKIALHDFKIALENYVKELDKKPLVFIIDELDRCHPNYAVEVLEKIKHFFSVPGIVFILSMDKVQLCSTIRGYFGSEKFNAEEYLRRFIDLEFSLPSPDLSNFVDYLFSFYQFGEFYTHQNDYASDFKFFAGLLFKCGKLSLRQQEKMFIHARVTLKYIGLNDYLNASVFLLLIYLKCCRSSSYLSIIEKRFSYQEVIDDVFGTLEYDTEYSPENIIMVEAGFVWYYLLYKEDAISEILDGSSGNLKIKPVSDYTQFVQQFNNLRKIRNFSLFPKLIKVIELDVS